MPHKPGFIHSGKDETSWNYFELPFGSGADYKKPIPLENLPYTPAVLGEMLENKEKEREIEIEGLGKGRLVISKQNNNKPFFYPDQSEEYTAKKSRQLQIGEIVGNLPLLTSPLTTLGKGVPKIIKTKRQTPRRLMEMSMKESSPKGAINLKQTVDGAFQMPMQQARNYYRRAANVAKKNHISLTDAFKYLDSIQKGIRPDKPIKPGNITGVTNKGLLKDTDVDDLTRGYKKGGLFDPDRDDKNKFLFMTQGSFDIPMVRSSKAINNIQQGVGILKNLNDKQKAKAIEIVKNLEQFHIAGLKGRIEGWKAGRPTTRYSGERIMPYTKNGVKSRMYWNWSGSKQTYKATDLDKLIETRLRRKNWDTNSPGLKGQSDAIYDSAKERNAVIKQSIKQLESTNPQLYREILGGDQTWYVEHIHAQKSPFWNKERSFKPRDPANIVAIGDDIFPKMKTAIEAILYSKKSPYKDKIYLDYDRETQNLILRDAETDLQIGSAIPGMTNTRDARKAFLRALEGGDPLTLAEINPDLRKFIDYQDKISESIAKQKPDVDKSGARPKETDRFDEYRMQRERVLAEIEAHNQGLKVVNQQYLNKLQRELSGLNKIIDQGSLFDTKPGQGLLKNLVNDLFLDDR